MDGPHLTNPCSSQKPTNQPPTVMANRQPTANPHRGDQYKESGGLQYSTANAYKMMFARELSARVPDIDFFCVHPGSREVILDLCQKFRVKVWLLSICVCPAVSPAPRLVLYAPQMVSDPFSPARYTQLCRLVRKFSCMS